ncbi:addiction module antitoxin RelB [Candidatus Uhrbacteria bacterium RIFCSPHIGHO2_12_FULL_46_13]|uniref:Addiction module antitoxin RelB n=1 Tax=Candidatus Uhrbacteria bacterium RIFCSPLOWO2_01_FULL_47_25 TaxID=1802402 RepID=A0A1F7UTN9_9BACT|nr:MAG: Toxin-antitoxin system, toxin component, RelE family [Parcubacteria group bacterium GW2011_GWA2_46_9]OGL76237.1 MAG: addiction module antitoxin RelB [Candidatus Uhrbacteria bacterium RIFCSPHIGHO2_12_FULL_46_13]OGL81635.1 MAG: addiction module antitoxin RelB [Candidatus Uhrbacteria bacterium RIFCSPLOWO2_01_FULL_47_25]OGL84800.1 MAG: addiction module antitoxin RelB [Candidatus Uhrbacteria bacterium RIFCSPLOWO2_02_FULL_46_19]
MYTIQYHPLVVHDDIPKLDATHKQRIKRSIEQRLLIDPETFGIPLRRSLRGYRKLRVGDYRIVFRIAGNTVYILAIMHRSIVYDHMSKRVW